MVFKKIGDREAEAKTFSGDDDNSYDLAYESEEPVSLSNGTSLSVKTATSGACKFTFAYAIRDDGYGLRLELSPTLTDVATFLTRPSISSSIPFRSMWRS